MNTVSVARRTLLDPERLEGLVDSTYELLLDRDQWPQYMLKLAEALGGSQPMLFLHDLEIQTRDPAPISVGYDPSVLRAYREYLAARNVWVHGALPLLQPGRVRISHNMCSRSELLRSQWWTEFCRPLKIDQAIGATIHREGSLTYNIAVLGNTQSSTFGADHIAVLKAVVPHIQRALKLHTHLAEQEARHSGVMAALETMSQGILLVRGDASIAFMNRAAEDIISARDGLLLEAGALRSVQSEDTAKLRRLVGEAAETSAGRALHSGGTLRISRSPGKRPLEVVVSPTRVREPFPLFARPIAVVFVTDPDAPLRDLESIGIQRHGLTPAEARVAARVAQGNSVRQIAAILGVSRNTVKTQLKAAFAKTGASRQTQLLKLLMDGPGS
jgi:DNA-binding CsgD family transcriptional regulator